MRDAVAGVLLVACATLAAAAIAGSAIGALVWAATIALAVVQ